MAGKIDAPMLNFTLLPFPVAALLFFFELGRVYPEDSSLQRFRHPIRPTRGTSAHRRHVGGRQRLEVEESSIFKLANYRLQIAALPCLRHRQFVATAPSAHYRHRGGREITRDLTVLFDHPVDGLQFGGPVISQSRFQ